MEKLPFEITEIFKINSEERFAELALEIFRFQYQNNKLYRAYCDFVSKKPDNVHYLNDIPFLPISFFKSHRVVAFEGTEQITFTSSGTTGQLQSKHSVADATIYECSFLTGFQHFYGRPDQYYIFGLLPSYLEREGSSLIYMVDALINQSNSLRSGFYLNEYEDLIETIKQSQDKPCLLIGVSYALLDLAEYYPDLGNCIVMETGGMKGKRAELTKADLHEKLRKGLGVSAIHSEYGMTELLSQAYSSGDGLFSTPPWMKILVREPADPFHFQAAGKSGGINVIDLANIYSCAFIETEDIGKVKGNQFEILGRLDRSDIRGCNLLIQ